MNWVYEQPVKIKFGTGIRKNIYEQIEEKHGLLITSKSFVKSGLAKQIEEYANGKITAIFSEVTPNPDVKECLACFELTKEQTFDFVVALGGGSVIDLAKVISVLAVNDVAIEDILLKKVNIPDKHLPLYVLPTTSGTGSEVTCVAVISDHEKGCKVPLRADSFYPKTAIIDPELTYSVSERMSACTGFDVLCHAIEGYMSKNHQPICDALAVHALQLVFRYLPCVVENGNDYVAREKMAEASVIAGLAFTQPQTTSSHACSYPLTNMYGIPHGEACALTIDYFLEFNHAHGCTRVLELAKLMRFETVDKMVEHIKNLKETVGLLCDLKSFDINERQLHQLVKDSMNTALENNPVKITATDLEVMYKSFL